MSETILADTCLGPESPHLVACYQEHQDLLASVLPGSCFEVPDQSLLRLQLKLALLSSAPISPVPLPFHFLQSSGLQRAQGNWLWFSACSEISFTASFASSPLHAPQLTLQIACRGPLATSHW